MAIVAVLLLCLVLAARPSAAADGYCELEALSHADLDACGLATNELWGYNSNLYTAKKCTNAACQRLFAAADAANPSECLVSTGDRVGLRATVLAPLEAACAKLRDDAAAATTSAPPPTTPPATATVTTPAPATEVSPVTPPPPTLTPTPLTSPPGDSSTERPIAATANRNDSSSVMDATPAPNATRSTTVDTTQPAKGTATTPWVIGAVGGVVVAVLIAVIVRRRLRRDRTRKRPETTQTTTTASGTTGSGPFGPSGDWSRQEHHTAMDEMLVEDRKIAAWRLFSAQVRDVKFLGKGSHAFVHLVELANGTLLASKRLALDQATPKHLQQLLTEVHIVATLNHASIVQFKGVTWTDAMDFQVLFEYMRGGDLRHYLDKQRQASSPTRTEWTPLKFQIALSVAEGLAYAHSFTSPLVHRDLKSRNILLTEELRAKISDFGVSRFQSENDTMTTGVGTNRWLAPEVLVAGGAYNEKCDIYSFGVVMTELDTHEVPLDREISLATVGGRNKSEMWVLREIAKGTLRPSMTSAAPSEVRNIAEQCLSFNAGDRPDALELSYMLRKMIEKSN